MKLKVKDISNNYNRYSALRGVNLELEPGLYGLLGPNGAGKSTLLKIIAGILRPTAGSILLEPVSKLGEHYRAMLGYMPQDLGIYPEFTAKRYLLYIAALKGLTEAQAKAEIDKLLEAVGLSSNAEQKLKGFSGGMLRRVGIAQTLLCNPIAGRAYCWFRSTGACTATKSFVSVSPTQYYYFVHSHRF